MIAYLLLYRKGIGCPVKKKLVESEFDAEYYSSQFIDYAAGIKEKYKKYANRQVEHILFTFKMDRKYAPTKLIDAFWKIV